MIIAISTLRVNLNLSEPINNTCDMTGRSTRDLQSASLRSPSLANVILPKGHRPAGSVPGSVVAALLRMTGWL